MSLKSNHYDSRGGQCCHNCRYSEVMEDGTCVCNEPSNAEGIRMNAQQVSVFGRCDKCECPNENERTLAARR